MKTLQKLPLLLLLVFIITSSCKKYSDTPENPELMGNYTGNTNQSKVIELAVDKFEGNLVLTQLKITVLFGEGGQQLIERYNSDGITSVNNRYFKYSLGTGTSGEAFVDGTFNSTSLTVTGTYKVYNPSNPNDFASGTYFASHK